MSHSRFHSWEFILRRAWLSLWNKHMTTGRINLIAIVRWRYNRRRYNCEADLDTHALNKKFPFRGGKPRSVGNRCYQLLYSLTRPGITVRSFFWFVGLVRVPHNFRIFPQFPGSRGFRVFNLPENFRSSILCVSSIKTPTAIRSFVFQRNNHHQGFHTSSRLSHKEMTLATRFAMNRVGSTLHIQQGELIEENALSRQ